MSISPDQTEEKVSTPFFTKAGFNLRKISTVYFAEPLHVIFYIMLFATMVGLFFGMSFHMEYYLILGGMGVVKLVSYFYRDNFELKKPEDQKEDYELVMSAKKDG